MHVTACQQATAAARPLGPLMWACLFLLCMVIRIDGAAEPKPFRLLLATGTRLFWWNPETGEEHAMHEQGTHFGVVPGKMNGNTMSTVWGMVRDEIPRESPGFNRSEFIVEFDMEKEETELQRIQIDSFGTHDMVKIEDRVFGCDTQHGILLELHYENMTTIKKHQIFTVNQHINTICPISKDELYIMAHNMGWSKIFHVKRNSTGGLYKVRYVQKIGFYAHGLVKYGPGLDFIYLDSNNGGLMKINFETGCHETLYVDPFPRRFFKGLMVADDVAYLGSSIKAPRKSRTNTEVQGEVIAFHLLHRRILWRKTVNTKGLLNLISAPYLGDNSTSRAVKTGLPQETPYWITYGQLVPTSNPLVLDAVKLITQKSIVKPSGMWPSGALHMDLSLKNSSDPIDAGLYIPLGEVDVEALEARWWEVCISTMFKFVNCEEMEAAEMMLIQKGKTPWQSQLLPTWEIWVDKMEPLLLTLFGPDAVLKIVRLAIEVPALTGLRKDEGEDAANTHRIVLPFGGTTWSTQICPTSDGCLSIPAVSGVAYEINNLVEHKLEQDGGSTSKGLLLVMDVLESSVGRAPPHMHTEKQARGCSSPSSAACGELPKCNHNFEKDGWWNKAHNKEEEPEYEHGLDEEEQ